MADTYSGAAQQLTIDGDSIDGVGTGFSGLTLTIDGESYDETSAGLTITNQSGYASATASFSVLEGEHMMLMLGLHGSREEYVWTHRTGETLTFDAVASVDHVFEDRGPRRFNVSLEIDGAIT